jgi:hypothetical protein
LVTPAKKSSSDVKVRADLYVGGRLASVPTTDTIIGSQLPASAVSAIAVIGNALR